MNHKTNISNPSCNWLPLLTVADYRVELGLCVTLHSALQNLNPNWGLDIRILSGAVGSQVIRRIKRTLNSTKKPYTLTIIPITDRSFKSFYSFANGSLFTYARFLFPNQFSSLKKALYLDVDTLVLGDLSELYETSLNGKSIGAVIDRGIVNAGNEWGILNYKELGIPPDTPYFNGGVLLMDLEIWRNNNLATRCLDYAARFPDLCMFWDQTVMNTLLAGDFTQLPETWNQQFQGPNKGFVENGILHYAGPEKPWNFQSNLPGRLIELYLNQVDRTDWKGWRPRPKPTLLDRIRRKTKKLLYGF